MNTDVLINIVLRQGLLFLRFWALILVLLLA